jgi:CHAD domain-containing protein
MSQRVTTAQRVSLDTDYLDTEDARLARAGLEWRVRREGWRWIQTLASTEASPAGSSAHEVIRPSASPEAEAHAGTDIGKRLMAELRRAFADGCSIGVRCAAKVRRTVRRARTRGATVEVVFDEGRLRCGAGSARICSVRIELLTGSVASMIGLVDRWRKRFALVLDPYSESERGRWLLEGLRFPQVRKAGRIKFGPESSSLHAFAAVVDECVAQIAQNVFGLCEGDPALRSVHVHQLRVGVRRLRTALRCFDGWVPPPPPALVAELRALFAEMGQSRDSDVLDAGVAMELAAAGAPPLQSQAAASAPDPHTVARSDRVQGLLVEWLAWRYSLEHLPMEAIGEPEPGEAAQAAQGEVQAQDASHLGQLARRRLSRWHRRIAADWQRYAELDEAALHQLRKRIKRQRYAVEFFAPLLRRRELLRYTEALAAIQDRMGQLNDLFVARSRYQALLETDPAAWFAVGWITARIAELRSLAEPQLRKLAGSRPPDVRHRVMARAPGKLPAAMASHPPPGEVGTGGSA